MDILGGATPCGGTESSSWRIVCPAQIVGCVEYFLGVWNTHNQEALFGNRRLFWKRSGENSEGMPVGGLLGVVKWGPGVIQRRLGIDVLGSDLGGVECCNGTALVLHRRYTHSAPPYHCSSSVLPVQYPHRSSVVLDQFQCSAGAVVPGQSGSAKLRSRGTCDRAKLRTTLALDFAPLLRDPRIVHNRYLVARAFVGSVPCTLPLAMRAQGLPAHEGGARGQDLWHHSWRASVH